MRVYIGMRMRMCVCMRMCMCTCVCICAVQADSIAPSNTADSVNVVTTLPCASKCLARGDALTSAISRNVNVFELLFRDRLGQVRLDQVDLASIWRLR